MGRFAFHIDRVQSEAQPCLFTSLPYAFVDYARLTSLAVGQDAAAFREAWSEELARAVSNFDEHNETSTRVLVDTVFDDCDQEYGPDHPVLAGSDLGAALEILLEHKGRAFVLDVLQDFRVLLQAARLNSEALHLALNKYDKAAAAAVEDAGGDAPRTGMMRELLPRLYSSTMYLATETRSLAGGVQAVRELLEETEEEEEKKEEEGGATDGNLGGSGGSVGAVESRDVEAIKAGEYRWFMDQAGALSEKELGALVAHRGFHSEEDDSVARPIENSLSSFEYCWGAGVHLAECDVGVTKDDKIIMAHDEDFKRLALIPDEKSVTVVKDLTFREIMRLPLKHGKRPPLLVEVLRSAMAIGEHAKLVIEVKPGNSEIVDPLMMLFQRHPALLSRVAVIMSFDLYVMQDIADRFAVANLPFPSGDGLGTVREGGSAAPPPGPGPGRMAHTSSRSTLRPMRAHPIQSVSYGAVDGSVGPGDVPVPKLLLLTAHIDYGVEYVLTSVKDDFRGLADEVPVGDGIDGVYLEYQPEMLEAEGKKKMLKLAESYTVGVWMLKPRDPDALSICRKLVDECGVSYVNTDFHRDFFTS